MGRGKLRLELIRNHKERRMAFQKKKKALEKSARELSVLCGVDVGMIISDPFGESVAPSVWPPEPEVLGGLLECYKSKQGCHDSGIKTYNLSDFFEDQIEKEMSEKKNESTYSVQDEMISSMSGEDLKCFAKFLNAKICAVKERISMIRASTMSETHAEEATMNHPVQESRDVFPTMWNVESEMLPLPLYDSLIIPGMGMPQFLNTKVYAVKESIDMIKASRMTETHAEEARMIPPVQESRDVYPTMWNVESEMLSLPFYDPLNTPEIGMPQFADHSNIWYDRNQGIPSFYNV